MMKTVFNNQETFISKTPVKDRISRYSKTLFRTKREFVTRNKHAVFKIFLHAFDVPKKTGRFGSRTRFFLPNEGDSGML